MDKHLPDNWPVMSIAQANAAMAAADTPLKLTTGRVNGVAMKVYANAPPTLRVIFEQASQQFADNECLVYEDERITYDACARAVAHMAQVLAKNCGIKKGDRVVIAMRNYPQWPVAFFAAVSIGAIVAPLNSWWTHDELQYGLADSGAKVAIVDDRVYDRISGIIEHLPDLETVFVTRGQTIFDQPGVQSMDALIGKSGDWSQLGRIELPSVTLDKNDDVAIMYTSGTTGKPKGALASHATIIANIFNGMTCRARMFLRRGEAVPGPEERGTVSILMAIPFFHATGAFAVMIPAMMHGDKIVCMYKWNAGQALPIIEREKIGVIGGVPAIVWQILEHPDRNNYDLGSIESVSYGGAPSAPELVSQIKTHFPKAAPGNGWGMTETCATVTMNFGEDYFNRPDSAGAPPGAVELKIVGPDGETLPFGEVGELWCKSPSNCRLYWNKPEASTQTFIDGWVVTGDLARLDEDGFLYLIDRAKDMLIRGGENIYCIEIENALYEHPAVMDAAIVGIDHKILGQEVGAVIQSKPGTQITQEQLQTYLADRLARFKIPVEIKFLDEPLPRNANGKILKTVLRDCFSPRS